MNSYASISMYVIASVLLLVCIIQCVIVAACTAKTAICPETPCKKEMMVVGKSQDFTKRMTKAFPDKPIRRAP